MDQVKSVPFLEGFGPQRVQAFPEPIARDAPKKAHGWQSVGISGVQDNQISAASFIHCAGLVVDVFAICTCRATTLSLVTTSTGNVRF